MRFIAKDTLTGETVEVDRPDYTVHLLAEGNDNCDYNRAHWFGDPDELGLPDDEGPCHFCLLGPDHQSLRFQIIEVLEWRDEHPEPLEYLNR